mmetsp:Transcript_46732/g.99831  ORF Transcript_46732/g.99831 Transcript_46732/m.99831 type:complete len:273 (+) Transcript_46732:28-846(+)
MLVKNPVAALCPSSAPAHDRICCVRLQTASARARHNRPAERCHITGLQRCVREHLAEQHCWSTQQLWFTPRHPKRLSGPAAGAAEEVRSVAFTAWTPTVSMDTMTPGSTRANSPLSSISRFESAPKVAVPLRDPQRAITASMCTADFDKDSRVPSTSIAHQSKAAVGVGGGQLQSAAATMLILAALAKSPKPPATSCKHDASPLPQTKTASAIVLEASPNFSKRPATSTAQSRRPKASGSPSPPQSAVENWRRATASTKSIKTVAMFRVHCG